MEGKAPAPIWRIGLRFAGADPRVELRSRVELAADERVALLERLDRFDAASRHGPWTRQVLALIRTHPGRRAPDLAAELGRETLSFKRDVRKLKELGLTESLEVGYRLSPRGEALLGGPDPPGCAGCHLADPLRRGEAVLVSGTHRSTTPSTHGSTAGSSYP